MILRDATVGDAPAMAEILNRIIEIGGTTAHQRALTPDEVCTYYIAGPGVETSVVAQEGDRMAGWQSVGLWQDEMHIGTFVRPGGQARGVGRALFAQTCQRAQARGLTRIIAHIRADNGAGLAYYARLGFRDCGVDPAFALDDGTVVGRVFRAFDLGPAAGV